MTPKQWLDDYAFSNIHCEPRFLEDVDEIVEEILDNAIHQKYTKESIVTAADGNLRKYVYDAVTKSSGAYNTK